jgi:hypothetical protein
MPVGIPIGTNCALLSLGAGSFCNHVCILEMYLIKDICDIILFNVKAKRLLPCLFICDNVMLFVYLNIAITFCCAYSNAKHTWYWFYFIHGKWRRDRETKRLIDWLFTVLRSAQEYFTYMETSYISNIFINNTLSSNLYHRSKIFSGTNQY